MSLEFHRPSRNWIQVRCSCGHTSKDPLPAWSKRPLGGFEYWCDLERKHYVSDVEAARLRELCMHPGWT
jgi:hypothetical protein